MGKSTFKSIRKYSKLFNEKPVTLEGRFNIVLDNSNKNALKHKIKKQGLIDTVVCSSLEQALKMCQKNKFSKPINEVNIIGGKMLYEYAIKKKEC